MIVASASITQTLCKKEVPAVDYFDDSQNVEAYVKMAEGYDGRELIDRLSQHLPVGSTILELGSGPGVDLDMLAEKYQCTGSDQSQAFVDRYRNQNSETEYLRLNAAKLDLDRKFDCIYSNKVLHHLTQDDLVNSFDQQCDLLTSNGLICHSFWYGNKTEEHHGLLFNYYQKSDLENMLPDQFCILEMMRYSEMDENDSILLLAKLQS